MKGEYQNPIMNRDAGTEEKRNRDAVDSLFLKRIIRSLQHILPRDVRLNSEEPEVVAAIRGGIEALGKEALLDSAAVFAAADENGDGCISVHESLRVKVLPARTQTTLYTSLKGQRSSLLRGSD